MEEMIAEMDDEEIKQACQEEGVDMSAVRDNPAARRTALIRFYGGVRQLPC